MKIEGCIALVTGANRGLGEAFASALLAAGAAKVYAGARRPESVRIAGVQPVKLDITNVGEVERAAAQCNDVTLLINNAAIALAGGFLGVDGVATTREAFETNFYGTLEMCSSFAPVLKRNGGGAIVNMLSVLSWINRPAIAAYCASKSAEWSLTNGVRNELRVQGTLVIGVHAAFIDTDMARGFQAPKSRPEEVVAQVLRAIEAGAEEVLADERTRLVKGALSLEQSPYLAAPV
jgi:NAD(P)-dependent dehydrogenase (short-subunit alcohol dehydrogenase family)